MFKKQNFIEHEGERKDNLDQTKREDKTQSQKEQESLINPEESQLKTKECKDMSLSPSAKTHQACYLIDEYLGSATTAVFDSKANTVFNERDEELIFQNIGTE